MKSLRFSWDQEGRISASARSPRDVLAGYLSQELQSDVNACRRVLDTVRRIRAGALEAWEGPGTSWTLLLTRGRAEIASEDAVPGRRVSLPLEELEEAVDSWLQFIELARS